MEFKDFRIDIENFPIERRDLGIWFITIDLLSNEISYLTSSKTNKESMLDKMSYNDTLYIIGFWRGEWRCDGFLITKEFLEKNKDKF